MKAISAVILLLVLFAVTLCPLPAAAATSATHPLEPLSAAEFKTTYAVVRAHFTARGLPTEPLLFPAIELKEPPKAVVRAWSAGQRFPREAKTQVMHYPSNRTWVAIVDLITDRVSALTLQPKGTQPSVTAEEFVVADAIVRAHEPWRAAMRRRGVDPDLIYIDTWAPGDLDVPAEVAARLPDGQKTRFLRNIAFHRGAPLEDFDPVQPQNPYARPVEGVIVTLDMNQRRVVHMVDTLRRPVIAESGNAATRRGDLKRLRVVQPQGSSISLVGRHVRWQRWSFYAVLSPREGLVLYDVAYDDNGRRRPVAYRLSLSEVYVPYGVPDNNWIFRTAFDVGEYYLATYAQTLEPNRDVPENATFIDAVFSTDVGPSEDNPTGTLDYPATIALYERDSGILWTRTDPTNFVRDTRFGRELVVTWNAWIGNYIYGFDWIFKMDGSMDVRLNATGSLQARGAGPDEEPWAPPIGIDANGTRVLGPTHQHFVNFRLDLDIDGPDNAVSQSNVGHVAVPGFKNVFAARDTPFTREGFDDTNPASARTWHIGSASRHNALGEHTAYELVPGETAVPYSTDDFPPLVRAQFAKHPLWVTKYKDGELYAAGDFPNQGHAGAGLPAFTSPAEALNPTGGGADIVIWYTAGLTHIPRPEDYPVMPTESIGFRLVPHGFFARNPALDAPDQKLTVP